jgi:hypothetical protein
VIVHRTTVRPAPRLPVLADGPGTRIDCAHYEGCITRWQQAHRGDRSFYADTAHCPPACAHHTKPTRSIDATATSRRDGLTF